MISSIRCRTRADGRRGGGGLRATGCRGTPGCGNACPTLGVPCWGCPAEGAEPGQRRGGAGWRAGGAGSAAGDGGDAFAWRAWPDGVRGRSTGGTVTAVGAGRSQRTGGGGRDRSIAGFCQVLSVGSTVALSPDSAYLRAILAKLRSREPISRGGNMSRGLRRSPIFSMPLLIALAFWAALLSTRTAAPSGFVPDCGDGVCVAGENCDNCPSDCFCGGEPVCGDLSCDLGEGCGNCPEDCGPCSSLVCGNGYCEGSAGETCSTCPADCGACPTCGNGVCNSGESCFSCAADCGPCPPCGNGVCEAGESCTSCSLDCGECPATCGNNRCEFGESCTTCRSDCGPCLNSCGNGTCDASENCVTCPQDCHCGPPNLPVCNHDHQCSSLEQCPCSDCCPSGGHSGNACEGDYNCAPGYKCIPGTNGRSCVDEWILSSLAPQQTPAGKPSSDPFFPRSAIAAAPARALPGRSGGGVPVWARSCPAPSRGRSRFPW